MVWCKAVALAASFCFGIAYCARIKAPSKWIVEEQPLADQWIGAASTARINELSLDELRALDERVMPATAPPSVPAIPLQMAPEEGRRRREPDQRRRYLGKRPQFTIDAEVPATAQPPVPATELQEAQPSVPATELQEAQQSVPATELQEAQPSVPATNIFLKSSGITAAQPSYEATLPSAASKKRKGPEAPQHTFDGALQDEVVVLQGRAVREEEMLLGNSSAHDLELELDEVDHSGTEGGINIVEVLSYMVDELEYEADGSLVGPLHEAQTSGGWMEDLWGKTPDDVDFEEAMQKYEEAKCTKWIGKSGSKLKMKPLKECCKVARIWSSCDHGRRSLASMIRSFDTLCKRFPSLPRHRIAKAASLQDLGLFAASVEGSSSGIGRYNHQWNWLQDPCVTKLTKMPLAQLKKCCADNGLDTTGVGPVLKARLKAHGRASVLKR